MPVGSRILRDLLPPLGGQRFTSWYCFVHVVSDNPLGPFEFCGVVLRPRTENLRDRDLAHNPTVIQANEKWILYYFGNKGNCEFWNLRNNQRIGVAVADTDGPFVGADQPPLPPRKAGDWDGLMTRTPHVHRPRAAGVF